MELNIPVVSVERILLAHVLLEYILEKSMVSSTENVPEISDTYYPKYQTKLH